MDIRSSAYDFMRRNGWTQAALARAVGIHPVTLCRLLAAPKKPETAYDKLFNFLASHSESLPSSASPSTPTGHGEGNG